MIIYSDSAAPFRASRGKHRNVAEGTCLMELASVFGGEPFSDHPRCVHPALAELARLLNDHLDDDVRQTLVPHVPDMMDVRLGDLRAGPVIAISCLDTALAADLDRSEEKRLRRYRHRIHRRLQHIDDGSGNGALRRGECRLAVSRGVRIAVGVGAGHLSQDAMATMLIDATAACHVSSRPDQQEPARSDGALVSTAV